MFSMQESHFRDALQEFCGEQDQTTLDIIDSKYAQGRYKERLSDHSNLSTLDDAKRRRIVICETLATLRGTAQMVLYEHHSIRGFPYKPRQERQLTQLIEISQQLYSLAAGESFNKI